MPKIAETSINHFHQPVTQERLRTYTDVVRDILFDLYPDDVTLKELTVEFNQRTGYNVQDASLSQSLHYLRRAGKARIAKVKRPCRVNGIMKQAWTAIHEETCPCQLCDSQHVSLT